MKIKGIGRIFIIFIILFVILLSIKNIFQSHNINLSKIPSKYIIKSKDSKKSTSHLQSNIYIKLNDLEVQDDEIETYFFLENKIKEIKASIPKGRPIEWILWQFYEATKGTSYNITDCVYNKKKGKCTITFISSNPKKEKITLSISKAARFLRNCIKIAFLIEDFDFEADQTTMDFLKFPEPLTFSLIPFDKKSDLTAKAADEYNKEIIIHLPFESHIKDKKRAISQTIMIHHPEEKIRESINKTMKAVPNFAGFSYLLPSFTLEDSRVMGIVLNEIKKHHGYFIYKQNGKNVVVPRIAKKIDIPYREITIVIKTSSDVSAIEDKLKHYAVVAQKRSKVLISVEACKGFITALNNVLPLLQQNGIRLVYVSEIVKHPKK